MDTDQDTRFHAWFNALYARHTATLQFAEVRRALQALSQVYVQRRDRMAQGAVFDGAGKRAAFGLFYTPLHFLTVHAIVQALPVSPLQRIIDLGCGTGAGAAAMALAQDRGARVQGVDINAWAVAEARWNWQHLGVRGTAAKGDARRFLMQQCGAGDALLATYTVNELDDGARATLLTALLAAHGRGACVLIVEPIAKRMSPWWEAWVTAFTQHGGRADEWRIPAALPEKLALLDKAAGMQHRELTARTLFLPGTPGIEHQG